MPGVLSCLNNGASQRLIFGLHSDNGSLYFYIKNGGVDMEKLVKSYILDECNKLTDRHHDYLHNLNDLINRKSERYGSPFKKDILIPKYWEIYKGFNPFKVKSKKLLDLFAYTLAERLKSGNYKPQTAIKHLVPKLGGGKRELNIFPIPDASVSRLVYKTLLQKNVNRFSSYAYAYREERNAHDAILKIAYDWRGKNRVYV